jgi:hypothetical protein
MRGTTFPILDFITMHPCACLAEIMVPSLERPKYMYELRQIADNIVREQCKHSELHEDLHFPTHTEGGPSYKVPEGSEFGHSPVRAASKDSPSQAQDSHVGPAFHIPMTQEKSLEDLPSQMDFDWQESASPCPSAAPTTARSLGEELDVVGTRNCRVAPTCGGEYIR